MELLLNEVKSEGLRSVDELKELAESLPSEGGFEKICPDVDDDGPDGRDDARRPRSVLSHGHYENLKKCSCINLFKCSCIFIIFQ